MEDVSKYPAVFKALIEDGTYHWSDEDLTKLAGKNLINTMKKVERVRDQLNSEKLLNTWIEENDLGKDTDCRTEF